MDKDLRQEEALRKALKGHKELWEQIRSGDLDGRIYVAKAQSPFSGCFWQWVFAFIHEGKLVWISDPRKYGNYQWRKDDSDEVVTDNLTDWWLAEPDDNGDFTNRFTEAVVRQAFMVAEENDIDWFKWHCSECGKLLQGSYDVYFAGEHGEGGISVVEDTVLCFDCVTKEGYGKGEDE